ncbi:MAG: hypothetical protein H0V00_00990 [Chloroflexia bacterium]|nr:hypothetical protein [Chloroflexia bacterium]
MTRRAQPGNIASVSWPDHLVFGEGDGRLTTVDALARRMDCWREALGATTLHWREVRTRHTQARTYAARGNPRTHQRIIETIDWDDFAVVPRLAHERGMRAELYVSVLDEGRPLLSQRERVRSFHNAMHGQHVTWQTTFSRAHSEYAVVDRAGETRQWGVLSFGYPEVREHFRNRIRQYTTGHTWDGVFLCLRTQARPAVFADQFGFNAPVREAMRERHGVDILAEDFDLNAWRDVQGMFFTTFLRELRADLSASGVGLSVGVPRGDIIGPPVGNWPIEWRTWAAERLIDALVIDQNSSQCPSMWHQLWPMHRGYGYLQNPIDELNLPKLETMLRADYGPVADGAGIDLFVARQWHERCSEREAGLRSAPGVTGLAFSTFRHDNPGSLARGDFRA